MSTNIPTPAELIEAARKNHDAEADALIARIVAKLRAVIGTDVEVSS